MVKGKGSSLALPRFVASLMTLVSVALASCPGHAQGFAAAISGTVKDTSGAAVPGAAITAKHLETGLTRAVEADASGNYNLPSLPVGAYELIAEKMGFQQAVRRGINAVVAQEAADGVNPRAVRSVQPGTRACAAP